MGTFFQSILLLLMRLYWGLSFFFIGIKKIGDVGHVIENFQKIGISNAEVIAPLVGWIEAICGLLLAIGLFSRIVSIPLIVVMIGALMTAHRAALDMAFSNPQGLITQTPFNYLLTALVVFAFGPGKISLDYLLGLEYNKQKLGVYR